MASLERLQELLYQFGKTPIFNTFGMQLKFDEGGSPVMTLPHNPNLDQGMGIPHGGVYATMLDATGWFVSAASRERSVPIVTTEMSIHFLKAAAGSALKAEGKLIKNGARQDVVEISIHDDGGHLVGHAVGTYAVLSNSTLKAPSAAGNTEQQ